MKKITFILSLFLLTAFLFLNSCVSTENTAQTSDVWTGKITGLAEGPIKLFLHDLNGNTGTKKFSGEFSAKVTGSDVYGGGTMRGKISGNIKNNILTGKISGYVSVSDGDSPILGDFNGEISESRGSGIWNAKGSHDFKKAGNWTLKKK